MRFKSIPELVRYYPITVIWILWTILISVATVLGGDFYFAGIFILGNWVIWKYFYKNSIS